MSKKSSSRLHKGPKMSSGKLRDIFKALQYQSLQNYPRSTNKFLTVDRLTIHLIDHPQLISHSTSHIIAYSTCDCYCWSVLRQSLECTHFTQIIIEIVINSRFSILKTLYIHIHEHSYNTNLLCYCRWHLWQCKYKETMMSAMVSDHTIHKRLRVETTTWNVKVT